MMYIFKMILLGVAAIVGIRIFFDRYLNFRNDTPLLIQQSGLMCNIKRDAVILAIIIAGLVIFPVELAFFTQGIIKPVFFVLAIGLFFMPWELGYEIASTKEYHLARFFKAIAILELIAVAMLV